MKTKLLKITALAFFTNLCFSQEIKNETSFSLPIYLDLPGELNIKKGYQELNILGAYQNYEAFGYYRTAVEYSFSPTDNVGLEIEVPFNFYDLRHHSDESENKIEAIRIGGMYSIPNLKIRDFALSIGFYNDFEFSTFQHFGKPLFEGNAFHPFVGIAKIWDKKLTTLVFAGPDFKTDFQESHTHTEFRINGTIGYKIDKKNNYISLETNSAVYGGDWKTYLRPQARFSLLQNLSLGLGASIPAQKGQKGFGGFFRLIYNP